MWDCLCLCTEGSSAYVYPISKVISRTELPHIEIKCPAFILIRNSSGPQKDGAHGFQGSVDVIFQINVDCQDYTCPVSTVGHGLPNIVAENALGQLHGNNRRAGTSKH